jgi:hypothetical protein
MSIRVGESWRGRNGHRYWVSMGLGDVLALGLLSAMFILPLWLLWWAVVIEVWLAAESAVLMVTAVMVIAALARQAFKGAGIGDVTMTRLRFGLWALAVKGK